MVQEGKTKYGETKSLNSVIGDSSNNIHYGVKLSINNIGFDGKIFTFPFLLAFLLKSSLPKRIILSGISHTIKSFGIFKNHFRYIIGISPCRD